MTTFVYIADGPWRFDQNEVFDALRAHYHGRPLKHPGTDTRALSAEGWADRWEVNLQEDGRTFVIHAPPAPIMELASWVRSYVPDDVPLVIFDDQSSDASPLRPGITPDEVRAEFYPDAWRVEQMTPREPPSGESEWSDKPPHLP